MSIERDAVHPGQPHVGEKADRLRTPAFSEKCLRILVDVNVETRASEKQAQRIPHPSIVFNNMDGPLSSHGRCAVLQGSRSTKRAPGVTVASHRRLPPCALTISRLSDSP